MLAAGVRYANAEGEGKGRGAEEEDGEKTEDGERVVGCMIR